MADDEPTPEVEAPEEPAEEVEMSVLDALKEVSLNLKDCDGMESRFGLQQSISRYLPNVYDYRSLKRP
jgi:hypothetical protein